MPTKPVWSIENPNEVSSSQTRDGDSAEKRRQIANCSRKYGEHIFSSSPNDLKMRFTETRGMIMRSKVKKMESQGFPLFNLLIVSSLREGLQEQAP